jgi:hypothetical protein
MAYHFLRKVVHRDVRTLYSISELLECGHRYEPLSLLADSLTASKRECRQCAALVALPPSKPSSSVRAQLPVKTKTAA